MLLRRLIAPFWTRLFYYFFFLGINPWFFSRSDKVCGGNRGCKYWRHLVYDKPSGLHYFWQRWHKPPLKWESVGGVSVCLSLRDCYVPFRVGELFKKENKIAETAVSFPWAEDYHLLTRPPRFFLSASRFVAREDISRRPTDKAGKTVKILDTRTPSSGLTQKHWSSKTSVS